MPAFLSLSMHAKRNSDSSSFKHSLFNETLCGKGREKIRLGETRYKLGNKVRVWVWEMAFHRACQLLDGLPFGWGAVPTMPPYLVCFFSFPIVHCCPFLLNISIFRTFCFYFPQRPPPLLPTSKREKKVKREMMSGGIPFVSRNGFSFSFRFGGQIRFRGKKEKRKW